MITGPQGTEAPSLKRILEGLLHAADRPLSLAEIQSCLADDLACSGEDLRQALQELGEDYRDRAVELVEVASGFRLQVRQELEPWVARLWEERPPRYSRALLETLALIAYRQPITRGEIEDIRGVSVSTSIIRTLQERSWVRVLGHKDVPGRPAMYGTTRQFLDYFNLKTLGQLPTLAELTDLEAVDPELELALEGGSPVAAVADVADEPDAEDEAGDSAETNAPAVDIEAEGDGERAEDGNHRLH